MFLAISGNILIGHQRHAVDGEDGGRLTTVSWRSESRFFRVGGSWYYLQVQYSYISIFFTLNVVNSSPTEVRRHTRTLCLG